MGNKYVFGRSHNCTETEGFLVDASLHRRSVSFCSLGSITSMSSAATPEFDEAPPPPVKKKISLKTSRAREKEKELVQKKEQPPKTPPPVDERVAHSAMRHFIAAQLHQFGFSSASTPLLDEVERCTVQRAHVVPIKYGSIHSRLFYADEPPVFTQVYALALQYANVSFRTDANVYDVVAACEEAGIDMHALCKVAWRKRKPNSSSKFTIICFMQHISITMPYVGPLNYVQLPKLRYLCFHHMRRLHYLYSSRLTHQKTK
jgi:hypothetical protein